MKTFLLKVEDVFDIKGRGLVLIPTIPLETKLPKSTVVRLVSPNLVSPNKKTLKTNAIFGIPLISFLSAEVRANYKPGYECILTEIDKDSVPIGTEIWLD